MPASKEEQQLSALKKAYLKLEELQAKIQTMEQSKREPLAIIGMGCRFPGDANDPEAFWRLLRAGKDAVTEIPPDRWDTSAFFDPDRNKAGKMDTRWGAFLRGVDQFDPQFFGISPREAAKMDPQQRLLMEVSWEALENAGIAPDRLSGSRTGVFVGMCKGDYRQMLAASGDPNRYDAYYASGTGNSVASGRLSYTLGLQGPSITVDTACSSSLVALHLGCQSLRQGESDMALVAGINLILTPENTITYCKSSMMAADGRCKTFDAGADGFVQGEGCGVVVLKRLSAASAGGDRVLAVIRGTAVNQDGPSSGLTAPHGPSQVAVVREALASGGVAPADIQYVEAHGTGTSLGDPIEVRAVAEALSEGRPLDRPILLGSVKTNIGHLEAAAGIAGLIKLVMALQHKEIPPHLHYKTPNPYIPWSELPVKVSTGLLPWAAVNGRRIAGISSFGFSGTNAHAIVEEAPAASPAVSAGPERPLHVLALSAKTDAALKSLTTSYAEFLEAHPTVDAGDLCLTANAGRSHFSHRLAVVGESAVRLREKLAAFAAGEIMPGVFTGRVEDADRPKTVFLFTGQGSQYFGMGRQLYETEPAFRRELDRCSELLRSRLPQPLISLLYEDSAAAPLLNETSHTQPVLFSLEYALAQMWISWGIVPQAVLGHSLGEYVAACVAGVVGLEDAIKLVAERGRLMTSLCPTGAMAAVFSDEHRVRRALANRADAVAIAAINGPAHVVISGAHDALAEAIEELALDGIPTQRLPVSHAFHSPLIEPMLEAFTKTAAEVQFAAPRIPVVSNLTGEFAKAGEITTAAYWRRHLREPVRFAASIAFVTEKGYRLFVEVGPMPTLSAMAKRCLSPGTGTWVSSLSKGRDDWEQVLESLGTLYTRGVQVDWAGFDWADKRRRLSLPTYPFQRRRYWFTEDKIGSANDVPARMDRHPMLQERVSSPLLKETIFQAPVSVQRSPLLDEHRVFGLPVLPAAAYLEMVAAAAADMFGRGARSLENVNIREAFSVKDNETRMVQLVFTPAEEKPLTFQVLSFTAGREDRYRIHATGSVRAGRETGATNDVTLLDAQRLCRDEEPTEDFYSGLEAVGIRLGSRFRCVRKLWRGKDEALGLISPTARVELEASRYTIHPALLDACIQIFFTAVFTKAEQAAAKEVFLPIAVERFAFYGVPSGDLWSHVTVSARPEAADARDTVVGDMRVFGAGGEVIAELKGLLLKRANRDLMQRPRESLQDCFYRVEWQPRLLNAQGAAATFLPTPADIAAHVELSSARLAAVHDLGRYEEFLSRLDELCGAYVVRALGQLGWEPRLYERVSATSLSAQLGIANAHQRLLQRFLRILEEDGILKAAGSAWEVARLPETVDIEAACRELSARFPFGGAELNLVQRGGENLGAALRGQVDPTQILFPNGSLDLADKLYRESPPAQVFNTLAREALAAALARLPEDRRISVLEIGAGTGGTSSYVVGEFPPERTEYLFTDLSPFFLAQARERFAAHPFVRYQTLNIEQDPYAQGFAEHSFDLIIAANVLHATADLRQTLSHVKQLLARGGTLMLLEVTRPQRWIDLSFGLTEGWWLFSDTDLRPSYPLLTRESWTALLGASGFTEALAIPDESASGALAYNTLLLARGSKTDQVSVETGAWILFGDKGSIGEKLSSLLRARNETVIFVTQGEGFEDVGQDHFTIDPACAEDYLRLIREVSANGRPALQGAIHLWSLDDAEIERKDGSELIDAQRPGTQSVLFLVQALVTAGGQVPTLWLVTRGAQPVGDSDTPLAVEHAPLWGMGKVIELEHPELRCVCLDLDPAGKGDEAEVAEQSARMLFDEIVCSVGESQIVFRESRRYVARLERCSGLIKDAEVPVHNATQLVVKSPGILDSLQLEPVKRRRPGRGEIEIRVHATGLNFHDVLYALGMLNDTDTIGGECAGKIVAIGENVNSFALGDEVVAVAPGSFRDYITVNSALVAPKPKQIGSAEAAGFPLVFLTADHALRTVGQMQPGERLLIHSAAGGVGLAAIQLAQLRGLEIFATASTPEKREFLSSLGVRHVMNSRSGDFAQEIMRITDGEGIDLVLNSLTGDAIPKSLALLRRGGRFLEIGKAEIWHERRVSELNPNASYHPIDLSQILMKDPASVRPRFVRLMEELSEGLLKPLPTSEFSLEDGQAAFRYMAQGKHIGKLVLTQDVTERGRGIFCPDVTYLVTGGLRGLGLLTAEWLVNSGARHLVLIGRNPPAKSTLGTLERLGAKGAVIRTMQADVSNAESLVSVIDELEQTMPPLRGVIHAAGTLADGALVQQDWSRFREVMNAKIAGAWNLHNLTKDIDLDFFVLFSSIAAILGAPGQANHAAANAFMDALAHHRRRSGLPGLSINWGVWSKVGVAAERDVDLRAATQGMGALTPQQGLRVLEQLLVSAPAQLAVMPVNWSKFLSQEKSARRRRFFTAVMERASVKIEAAQASRENANMREQFENSPPKKRMSLLAEYIRQQAVKVLNLDPSQQIDPKEPLTHLGLDSLMAVELRNLLGAGLSPTRNFPATLIFDYPTVAALTGYLAREAFGWSEKVEQDTNGSATADTVLDLLENLEDLSDQEVDRLFAERTEGQ